MPLRRALVIDDEQIILDSVTRVLNAGGYEVDATASARQGIEWAVQRGYDVVLSDIRMPDIGGMRVLRDVKRANPALPVVIITGYATVQSAVQAMKLGAADYLEKPFTPEELLGAVSAAVDPEQTRPTEPQGVVHRDAVLAVLDRAAVDRHFVEALYQHGADALAEYGLTGPEMLALLTGDLHWVQTHAGPLSEAQQRWFEHQVSAEIW